MRILDALQSRILVAVACKNVTYLFAKVCFQMSSLIWLSLVDALRSLCVIQFSRCSNLDHYLKTTVQSVDASDLTEEIFLHDYLFEATPVVIKNALASWPARRKWSTKYLRKMVGKNEVNVDLSADNSFNFYGGLYEHYFTSDSHIQRNI